VIPLLVLRFASGRAALFALLGLRVIAAAFSARATYGILPDSLGREELVSGTRWSRGATFVAII